ncbi:hypothetical protein D3C72_199610 [compost metagenome]
MAIKRERLISPLFIGIFGGAIGLSGALLLKQNDLVDRVKKEPPNALSVAYLEAWIRIRSDDMELRSLLASQYIRSGRLPEAQALIAELLASKDAKLKKHAVQLQMDLIEQQLWAMAPEDPQRPVVLAELSSMLNQSSEYDWSIQTLKVLAIRAHALSLPKLSAQFFQRLAKLDPMNTVEWRQLSSDWALADGRYVEAAEAAFERLKGAPTIALQREHFLRGLTILESGNLLNVAMKEAKDRITPPLQNDPDTLRVLIRLALSANRPDLAEGYAQRLLDVQKVSGADQLNGEAVVMRYAGLPVSRVNDYQPASALPWIYLDGVRGNAVRTQLDANAKHAATGMVRVSTIAAAAAADNALADTPPDDTPTERVVRVKSAPQKIAASTAPASDLELTYNVFLADQKLEKALEVVNLALKQNPKDPVWLKRRAVVNEWSGHPAPALQAWLALARSTGSAEAWQAVERLSLGLHDDVVYLEALRQRVGRTPDELLYVDQIVATYERIGDFNGALAFLRSHIAKSKLQKDLLERYAALAERIGEDDLALQTWQQLNARFGPNTTYALKIASVYSVQGKFDKAMNVLVAAQGSAKPTDYLYWRTLASVAGRVGRDDVARVAARNLIGNPDLSDADLRNMIALWDAYPIDAGRIAEQSFRRTGDITSLQQAIYQYSRAKAWARIDRLLDSLTPAQAEQAALSSDFLMAKAEYLRQTGRSDESLDTLRAAIAIEGGASDIRAAFLWALIDRGTDAELRNALQSWREDAEEDSQLWGPYAAGYMRLSEKTPSLHFFSKEKVSKYQDPLWALTYAEALETFGYPDAAWTLRKQAWIYIANRREMLLGKAKPVAPPPVVNATATEAPADIDSDAAVEEAEAFAELRTQAATLSQPYEGGDFSRALLLQTLRYERLNQDVLATGTLTELDQANEPKDAPKMALVGGRAPSRVIAQDVALAWALSNEPYELAREWMAQRYGTELQRPAYAEVAVALNADDRIELARLLEEGPDRIPVQSRVEANMRLDRWHAAQRVAFRGATGNPYNEELQDSVRETGLLNASYVEPGYRSFRQSPFNFTETDVEAGLRLTDRWTLTVNALSRQQKSVNPAVLVNVPRNDRRVTAGLGWRDADTALLFEAGRRQAVRDFTQARFDAAWNLQRSLSWNASLGYNQEATDTAELRIGGVKDTASLGALWRVGTREYIGARLDVDRFYDQDRRAIGKGNLFELEAGYNIRLEYPDFTIRTVYARANYKPIGNDAGPIFGRLSPDGVATTAEIMPSNFTQKGLLFGFGTDLRTNYTRAWRPFMEVGYLHDSRRGWGSTGRIGLAGTVFGNDHAVIYYGHDRSPKSFDGGTPSTEFGVRYRWYF